MAEHLSRQWLSLTIILAVLAGIVQALAFTAQPSNTSVNEGAESVVLKCKLDTVVTIRWFKDDTEIKEDYKKYTFTRDGLRIKNIVKPDAGVYYCMSTGLKSNEATLTVKYICKDGFQIKSSGDAFRGASVTLTCNCPSVPTPLYTWQHKNNVLQTTGNVLVLTNVQKSNGGNYVCVVKSGGKTATSLPHNLAFHDCSPPKVIRPPERETLFAVAKPLTVRCDAKGDAKLVVNWYHGSNKPMRNTTFVKILPNGALYFSSPFAEDAGDYQCVAKDSCYQSKTYTTKLVKAKIGSFKAMKDVLNRVGSTVSITCVPPSNSYPRIKNVTWLVRKNSSLPNDARISVVDGTLRIEKAQKSDSGTYRCVAENAAGQRHVDVAVIVAIYPEVTRDPMNKTIIENETARLECQFSGDPKPVITWEKNGESLPVETNIHQKTIGSSSVLIIKNAESDQSGKYRCSAKLKHVTERTKEATLFVKEKIRLETFSSEKFDEGKVAKLICKIITGTKPYHIRWVKQGMKEGLLPHMKVVRESTLLIENARMSDSGNYSCYVNNSFSSESLTFTVHIYDFAKIVLKPKNVTAKINNTVLFNCKATGIPKPRILWYISKTKGDNGWKPLSDKPGSKIFPNGSLLLHSVQKKDAAKYRCMAGNAGYIDDAVAHLSFRSKDKTTPPGGSEGTGGETDEHESDDMGKTVGIAVGCAGAYIILVVGLMIYCKGRRARQAKNKLIVNGEDIPLKPDDNVDNVEVVKGPEALNAPHYPRENLETLRTLGTGTYGLVFLAKASEISEGEGSSIVVVQSLTSDDEVVKKDFMRRMEMLSLKHENIAKLLGVCQDEGPMYLISEYPEQGDLKTVMRDSSTPLSPTQKVNICAAVASGMNYLTSHGFVHKDLAARNCLVNKSFSAKISFLSLNQGTYPKEYYNHKGELIPLRWMAPEALEDDYSDMSDVWSFGILMWEVYTEGILPYEERPDEEVLHSVADDLRLTKPEGCPGKIYKMMEKCWADNKEDRLTFGALCEDLSEIPREIDF
ncbi:inactive tyrosine-protein kinase 7-like isoform X2 [Dendronephthya gigantea]|uniref:inactive tyrosine-protein kinase 7-like isoform X2 n=1 Tax=Dendronephthya gigantea TaxID=151771 RepID=UPI001069F73B|nr:inactive tyrosine-protein kinase 7-like isoform X2 [Dendronephthya gigantea]